MATNSTRRIEEPAKEEKARAEHQKTEQIKQQIYVGPNLPGGGLSRFTVFRDGIPQYLEVLLQQQPLIKSLIVPVDELSAAMTRVETPGTLEHSNFQELLRKEGK